MVDKLKYLEPQFTVYFARSIRGERGAQDNKINKAIIEQIRKDGFICAVDIPNKEFHSSSHDVDIYNRDIDRLNHSDLLIAEVTHPSLGVGYEIAYAQHIRHIPIICFAEDKTRVSAMLTGSNLVMYYDPEWIEGLCQFIHRWLLNKGMGEKK